MLRALKDLVDNLFAPDGAARSNDPQHRLQLASAVMLVEMMRADAELAPAERVAVMAALHQQFGLAEDEMAQLMLLADEASRDASDYFGFTSRINEGFDMAQKVQMIEHMWRVAYSDGTLSAHENHLMRKVADLLYIPHGAYVHAKLRAREGAGDDA